VSKGVGASALADGHRRLAGLAAVVALLDALGFDERSAHRDFALQVLEEYWVPDALYRRPRSGSA
jgi:hypothetical protein